MSLIEGYKQRIEELTAENARLQAEILISRQRENEMKQDVSILSKQLKELMEYVEMDKMFSGNEDKKMGNGEVVRLLTKVGLKFTTGKINMSVLKEKWENAAPILTKYKYLLND